ncbi:L-aspartate oxidase [Tessaracoccus sp. MC1627]|nr:L-aspartate oxidase [Tessaracoccus sp. MC1627]MBB1513513.1 L-aspartate oxidase [Tessaracoccus sp. MC1627]
MLPAAAPAWTGRTDVVVVGTGAAGLSALLHLAAAGVDCVAVTRGEVTDSATAWAQGGLAAVWDDGDTLASHVADTLTAGAGLCDAGVVSDLVASAPGAIRRLIGLGARFDRASGGGLDLHLEGGHSARRIIHADGDATGAEIERALWAALSSALAGSRTRVMTRTRLVDVLTDAEGRACGVRLLDADSRVGELFAGAVVLATGGIGQLWPVTSNPLGATGDGVAAALRAGAEVRDLEFMQFHPTVLADADAGSRGVLVSEAVRGEGAWLVDDAGRRIMAGVHPLLELAPRDVVSAAIMSHLERTGAAHVWLDATFFGRSTWEGHFPGILALCRGRGVDPVTELIPVHPAAHYACGGVAADLSGRTSVQGLFAVGEVAATGVHGANRLASNSLTEALVAGDRVGALLAAEASSRPGAGPAVRDQVNVPLADLDRARQSVSARHPSVEADLQSAAGAIENGGRVVDPAFLPALRGWMQREAFVSRTGSGLASLGVALAAAPVVAHPVDHASLTATNLHAVATVIAAAAAERTESRGAHRRSDFAATSPTWERRIAIRLTEGGLELTSAPLTIAERTAA